MYSLSCSQNEQYVVEMACGVLICLFSGISTFSWLLGVILSQLYNVLLSKVADRAVGLFDQTKYV